MPAMAPPTAITALTIAGTIQSELHPTMTVLLGVTAVAVGAILVWIDANGWRLIVGLTALSATVSLACWGEPQNLGWFAMCVIAGWAALVLPVRWAITIGSALASTFFSMLVIVSNEPGWVTWAFGVVLSCGAFLFVRRQQKLVARLNTARSQLAQRARIDERHRIAREMHDLVGHSLTITLLHLGSARLALDDDIASAQRSLKQAEHAARASLDDVRSAVALLHTAETTDAPPVGAVVSIPDLIQAYRNAGIRINVDLKGNVSDLTTARRLATYRTVQESLTNAARHGSGSPITVNLDISAGSVRLVVCNDSPRSSAFTSGTGITAMQERVAAVGGILTAGVDRGVWRVEAVIPA